MNAPSVELNTQQYQTLALAAAAQSATLVHELASLGNADEASMACCLRPLLILDAESTSDIYPRPAGFNMGLDALQKIYGDRGPGQHNHVIRYLSGLLVLQKSLASQTRVQQAIREGLVQLQQVRQARIETDPDSVDEFTAADYTAFSQLYQETISTLSYRIHVAGNPEYLRNQAIADKIRSLLFAGIRSAMLWQQLGGRRWQLLFSRKRILNHIAVIRRTLITLH
ncbi:MAG: high frequency lysogenization protein HflD [Pseudomonadales bacterium]|nr:high frequency lysogenization protein HflD [Pseudomonadales bacterium]